MTIEKDKVVTFEYRLNEPDQPIIEDSRDTEPAIYLHGHEGMMPGLEEALAGKTTGDKVTVTLPPEKAYGSRQEVEPVRVPKKYVLTKGKLKAGMAVQLSTKNGPRDATLIKVGRNVVDIDSNHPLAGKTLTFEVEVVDVRDATSEEIEHKHVHGEGGHQH